MDPKTLVLGDDIFKEMKHFLINYVPDFLKTAKIDVYRGRNNTAVLVSFYFAEEGKEKAFKEEKKTIGKIGEILLESLQNSSIIKDAKNWYSTSSESFSREYGNLCKSAGLDPYYYAFQVHDHLLHF